MKKNKFALNIFTVTLIISSFIACDSDFNNLDSDVLNSDVATNFDILNDTYDIITYNNPLGPVQTNNGTGLSTLGIYDDVYGRVKSDFVAQLTLSNYDPDFGDIVEVDSVVLNLPFFSAISDIDEEGNLSYITDSVFGNSPMKLRIFESNYFIRDFDPNSEFGDSQAYFSNKSASTSEMISDASLEAQELTILPNPNPSVDKHITLDADGNITISDNGFILTQTETEGENQNTVVTRQIPGIRLKLDPTFWQNKILDQEGSAVLSNENSFLEYFRGLYFKVEPVEDQGSYLILSTSATSASITIYYKRLTDSALDDADTTEPASFAMRFAGDRINFFENNFNLNIPSGDPATGDSRLYLKGGEGAIAKLKLFNGNDTDDDDDTMNAFESWKNDFVETDANGNFVKIKRLVNEANLVFYVDDDFLSQQDPEKEPNRLYVYNIDNKRPLEDYFVDAANNSLPSLSRVNHLGALQRVDDEATGDGIKYKFRITEHINNLLLRDSTNIELGLAVSLNVNLEGQIAQAQVQSNDDSLRSPVSSILTPRGTVLHGNNTEDETKKVYLEIYYTEPND
ncbi:MAG: DUF4270 domain-containing protein [Winogradskyella sp.]